MLMTASELREEILKLNPMTSLYWDNNLKEWIILVFKCKEVRLPGNLSDYIVNSKRELPEVDGFTEMRQLIFDGKLVCYIISHDRLVDSPLQN